MKTHFKIILLIALIFIFTTILFAESSIKSTQVTVYNNNLGLVRQVRTLDVQKGQSEVRIEGIPALVDPTTVRIVFPGNDDKIDILEQNFLYDLVNSNKIFEKYIGEMISYRTKTGDAIKGQLLQYGGGNIVLQIPNAGIKIAATESIVDYDFPALPSGLILKPTLQWLLDSKVKSSVESEISYLTSGMSWHAEYLMVLDNNDRDFTLNSWVSLENNSGATYENAKMKIVAGTISRAKKYPVSREEYATDQRVMMAKAAEAPFEERGLFDYHLYELQRPVTIKDREIKQISLFNEVSAIAQKIYIFRSSSSTGTDLPLLVTIRFANSKANHLGIPLPEGIVRMFKKDVDNTLQLIGEDRINHTAKDDTLNLNVGQAFDVKGRRTVKDSRKLSDRSMQESIEIEIRNSRTESVSVEVLESWSGDWFIKNASHSYIKKSASQLLFPVTIPAEKSVTITYTIQRSW